VIEPNVDPSTVTVLASKSEEEKPAPPEEEEAPKEETKPEEEKKPEETKPEEEKKPEEEAPKEEPAKTDQAYTPKMEGIELRLGQTGKVTLSIASLTDGFRLAETTIISDGVVSIDKVSVLNPSYWEVLEHSEKSVTFRAGDFDGEVEPGTSELKLAEVTLEAVRVGWASLHVRTAVRTEENKEVVRTKEVSDINVVKKSIFGSENPPQDLNGDALYEDVNGDGKLTEQDVLSLAFNLNGNSAGISAPLLDIFDFNRDGVVNFDDAVRLMRMVEDKE
jgi:hypothetical protein